MAEHSHVERGTGGGGNAGRFVFWAFIAVAAYFVIAEHRAHVVPFLPFLLLLLCPLLHMSHGHGGHSGHEGHREETDKSLEQGGKMDSAHAQRGGH